MESFATKKVPFKFSLGGAPRSGKEAAEPAGTVESTEPMTEEAGEYTSDELGSVLAEAIKSGSGSAVYEAVARIVSHCGE